MPESVLAPIHFARHRRAAGRKWPTRVSGFRRSGGSWIDWMYRHSPTVIELLRFGSFIGVFQSRPNCDPKRNDRDCLIVEQQGSGSLEPAAARYDRASGLQAQVSRIGPDMSGRASQRVCARFAEPGCSNRAAERRCALHRHVQGSWPRRRASPPRHSTTHRAYRVS